MTQDELQSKYDRLFTTAKNMRKAFYESKNYRGSAAWNRMESYGRELDKLIKAEVKARESKEQELF